MTGLAPLSVWTNGENAKNQRYGAAPSVIAGARMIYPNVFDWELCECMHGHYEEMKKA
jgi:hypothetical protein